MTKATITFKEAFAQKIERMIQSNPKFVYLDADLMNCLGTNAYAQKYPKQVINCGIAEANMVGVAAGMCIRGFQPLLHSFAPFASRRCFDQVYMSAGYSQNDICILGSDGGICGALNGGTHQSYEDIALYRSLPQSHVFDFCDVEQLRLLPEIMRLKGVKYIRFYRKAGSPVYTEDSSLHIGKASVLREGDDVCIVSAGILVEEAIKAADILADKGICATVLDMFTVKPLDTETLLHYAKRCKYVLTAENHSIHGGLYTAVCAFLSSAYPCYVDALAVQDRYGEVGSFAYLKETMGLTAAHIVDRTIAGLSRKAAL